MPIPTLVQTPLSVKAIFYRIAASPLNLLPRAFGVSGMNSIGIITVHGVHTAAMERLAEPPSSSIRVQPFAAGIRDVMRRFKIISLDDAVSMLQQRVPWRERCVVLTFDDSLNCTAEIAAPVLSGLGVTATVFLSTEAIDEQKPYWWLRLDYALRHARRRDAHVVLANQNFRVTPGSNREEWVAFKAALRTTPALERDAAVASLEQQLGVCLLDDPSRYPYALPMTWNHARKLQASGWGIGSHTVTHPNLALLEEAEIRWEFAHSRLRIEQECRQPCRHVCYPYGSHTLEVIRFASEYYEAATTTMSPGWNRVGGDLQALQRFGMPGASGKLAYLLSGMPQVVRQPLRPT